MGSIIEDNKLRIEKFSGQNFRYWKMQMEDYLYQKDLFLPLQGAEGKPAAMEEGKWKVLDRKALATIRLNLHQHVTYNVSQATTTKELMDALAALYEKSSASNKVYLMKKLFNLKMQQGARVAEFLNEFQSVVQ
jgi:acyl-activating enzyme 14